MKVFVTRLNYLMAFVFVVKDLKESIANIITGSLSQLYKFREVHFSHVVRSGNKTARKLAQFAKGVSDQNA